MLKLMKESLMEKVKPLVYGSPLHSWPIIAVSLESMSLGLFIDKLLLASKKKKTQNIFWISGLK